MSAYVIAHYEAMISLYGVQTGVRHARKHLGWYLDRFAPFCSSDLRRSIMTLVEPASVIECLRFAFELGDRNAANAEPLAA